MKGVARALVELLGYARLMEEVDGVMWTNVSNLPRVAAINV